MNLRIFLTLFFLGFGSQFSSAGQFADANAAFKSGDFVKAAEGYEKNLKADGPSAAGYYNLGNAYQRQGQYGSAILAYERAKLITPRDPDLRANLELARKAVSAFDESDGNPNAEAFLEYFSRNEWSWIVVGAAFLGAGIVFAAGCVRIKKRWLKTSAMAGICAAVVVIGIAGTALVKRGGESERAVVVSKEGAVRLSPFASAEVVGTPGPGRIVTLGKREGEFCYVTVSGQGLSGWMAKGDFGRIEKAAH